MSNKKEILEKFLRESVGNKKSAPEEETVVKILFKLFSFLSELIIETKDFWFENIKVWPLIDQYMSSLILKLLFNKDKILSKFFLKLFLWKLNRPQKSQGFIFWEQIEFKNSIGSLIDNITCEWLILFSSSNSNDSIDNSIAWLPRKFWIESGTFFKTKLFKVSEDKLTLFFIFGSIASNIESLIDNCNWVAPPIKKVFPFHISSISDVKGFAKGLPSDSITLSSLLFSASISFMLRISSFDWLPVGVGSKNSFSSKDSEVDKKSFRMLSREVIIFSLNCG